MRKTIKICLITVMILALAYIAVDVFLGMLSANYFSRVRLTTKEQQLVRDLSGKCKCQVILEHDFALITGNQDAKLSDSTLLVFFDWDKTKGNYLQTEDLCNRDSIFLRNYVRVLLPHLLKATANKQYYRKLRVYFRTKYYEYLKDSLKSDAMMGYKCSKYVDIKL